MNPTCVLEFSYYFLCIIQYSYRVFAKAYNYVLLNTTYLEHLYVQVAETNNSSGKQHPHNNLGTATEIITKMTITMTTMITQTDKNFNQKPNYTFLKSLTKEVALDHI